MSFLLAQWWGKWRCDGIYPTAIRHLFAVRLTMAIMKKNTRSILLLLAIGIAVGMGGGTVMVPGLLLYGLTQRQASATSLAAMPLASLGGIISYAFGGHVNWAMGALVIIGTITGAWVGSKLLQKLSEKFLRWAFVVFLVGIVISQFFESPSRISHVTVTWLTGTGMVLLGIISGVLSALLGVGGGAVLVPGMSVLLAMMPGAISGTISNLKANLVDLKAAGIIGVVAMLVTPAGARLAAFLTPTINLWVFNFFLLLVLVKSVLSALKVSHTGR